MKYIVYILLFFPVWVTAQTYKYIGIEDGLSNRRIFNIQKDAQGYMWFLTNEGMDRYNGKDIKHYKLNKEGNTLDAPIRLGWLYTEPHIGIWVIGKPRGAGIIFILVFTITCMIFVNLSSEIIIYLILVLAAMLSGYLDDASSSPWGELKKGIIDFVIAVMAAVTYLHYNPNTFDISLFKLTVTLNPIIYGVLIVILIWVSINVTNCSDGVDGLCGTLSAITLSSAYVLFMIFDIESSFRHTILIMVVCILGYLWFNASPSKLLMGDAGSRAIGIFIAFAFLKLHSPLLYIPLAIVLIIDGGLGLIKVSFMRFLHIKIMQNIRTPIHDHMRKNKSWSDAQVVFRFAIIQLVIAAAIIYAVI